jgi:hypothetical protein
MTCGNELQRGDNCTMAVQLQKGTAVASAAMADSPHYFQIYVPHNTEYLLTTVRSKRLLHDLCLNQGNSSDGFDDQLVLTADLYMDQPNEDYNAGQQKLALNATDLCMSYGVGGLQSNGTKPRRQDNNLDLQVYARHPLPGVWTVRIGLTSLDDNATVTNSSADSQDHRHLSAKSSRFMHSLVGSSDEMHYGPVIPLATSRSKKHHYKHNATSIAITVTAYTESCPQGTTDVSVFNASLLSLTGHAGSHNGNQQSRLKCSAPVVNMATQKSPLIAAGYFSAHSDNVALTPVAVDSRRNGRNGSDEAVVVYRAALPPQAVQAVVGGGVLVQVQVSLDPALVESCSLSQFLAYLDTQQLSVVVRFGSYPVDARWSALQVGGDASAAEAKPANAFLLWSQDAVVVDHGDTSADTTDDDDGDSAAGEASGGVQQGVQRKYVRTYSWVVTRPLIPGLRAEADTGSSTVYLRMTVTGAGQTGGGSKDSTLQVSDLRLGASLVVEPCPKGSCVHGTCYTQWGDVPASTCSCR